MRDGSTVTDGSFGNSPYHFYFWEVFRFTVFTVLLSKENSGSKRVEKALKK
jgi:hypothetical protein